jgi:hypothetical protein
LFKKYNLAGEGNKANTRVRAVYTRLQDKIAHAARKYRAARAILLTLDPNGGWLSRLLDLKDDDIRGPGKKEDESHGRYTVSWIWMTVPSRRQNESNTMQPAGEDEVNDSLRVDWARSRARKNRWDEEVLLLQEEMRRVVVYLNWKGDWWVLQAKRRQGVVTPDIANGLSSYAYRQAAYSRQLAASCLVYWVNGLKELGLSTTWALPYKALSTQFAISSHSARNGMSELEEYSDEDETEEEEDGDADGKPAFYLDNDMYTTW